MSPFADEESAGALGAVELVAGQGEHVDVLGVHVDGQMAGGLDGVGVEGDLLLPADLADLGDGLDGADLVVGVHDGHQAGLLGDGLGHLLGGNETVFVDVQQGDGKALLLQLLEGVEDGVVLKGGGDDMGLPRAFPHPSGGEDGLVVGLAAAGGEIDLVGTAVEAVGHRLPGPGQASAACWAKE